jgi:hypothetical protein
MKIKLHGMQNADEQLARIERGTRAMANSRAFVGSRLPYAWGAEFGRHRVSGKLARAAGGAFYITRAVETVMDDADRDLSEGLKKVTAPGPWVLRRLALWARRLARKNAPRGPKNKRTSYRLRRSIVSDVRKR